jgi:hypothetical protein
MLDFENNSYTMNQTFREAKVAQAAAASCKKVVSQVEVTSNAISI